MSLLPAAGHSCLQLLHCTVQLATTVQEHVIVAHKHVLTAPWRWNFSINSETHVLYSLQLGASVHSLSLWQQA